MHLFLIYEYQPSLVVKLAHDNGFQRTTQSEALHPYNIPVFIPVYRPNCTYLCIYSIYLGITSSLQMRSFALDDITQRLKEIAMKIFIFQDLIIDTLRSYHRYVTLYHWQSSTNHKSANLPFLDSVCWRPP